MPAELEQQAGSALSISSELASLVVSRAPSDYESSELAFTYLPSAPQVSSSRPAWLHWLVA